VECWALLLALALYLTGFTVALAPDPRESSADSRGMVNWNTAPCGSHVSAHNRPP